MSQLRPRPLAIRETLHAGRGVFAAGSIGEGEVIEECPVVLVHPPHVQALIPGPLGDYFFWWGGEGHSAAVALGYGSLYNHAVHPNAWFVRKFEARTILFFALRPIVEGEEITINYNNTPGDPTPLWFEDASQPRPGGR
jgi:hypothetical protein